MDTNIQQTDETAIRETAATNFSLSYKVYDVPQAFKDLPQNGKDEKFKHLPGESSNPAEHVQGYTQYEKAGKYNYYFSYNDSGKGYLLATTGKEDKNPQIIEIHKDWSHPGGIQAIGTKLLIPVENNSKSKIFIYDIEQSKMLSSVIRYKDSGEIKDEFPHNAGCLGITDFMAGGKQYYLLAVCSSIKSAHTYHAYTAEAFNDISAVTFEKAGEFTLKDMGKQSWDDIECQGFGLVTDKKDGAVYLVALQPYSMLVTYEDWAFLIKIKVNFDKNGKPISISREKIDGRHLYAKGDSFQAGTHFRWGAGIHVKSNGRLVLLATSKKFDGYELDTNHWNRC
jgi:hypothetical protein